MTDALQWLEMKMELRVLFKENIPIFILFTVRRIGETWLSMVLNKLSEIRNTMGTVKEIINFFRESNIRRQLLPSIPMLRETRWIEKYKNY